MTAAASTSNGQDDGFVLVCVLFVLGFLALAAASTSRSLQTHLALTRNAMELANAQALAEAGIGLAVLDLVTQAQAAEPSLQGNPNPPSWRSSCTLPAGRLDIVRDDTAGRVDINHAGEPLLAAVLLAAGADEKTSTRIAAAIADFRDSDGLERPNGAELERYAQNGLSGPKNAPFTHVSELAQVWGIGRDLASKLAPFVTVHSGQAGIDAGAASPALVVALETQRQAAGGGNGLLVRSIGRTFTIAAQATLPSGFRFSRAATVTLEPAPGTDVERRGFRYRILEWQRSGPIGGTPLNPSGPLAGGLPTCPGAPI